MLLIIIRPEDRVYSALVIMPIYTLTLFFVVIGMTLVYKSVRTIENSLERVSMDRYRPHANTARRSHRVMVQGILYSCVILFNILFPALAVGFIARMVNLATYKVFEIIFVVIVPLQGFFNALIYLTPRVHNRIRIRRRRLNRDVRRMRQHNPQPNLAGNSFVDRIRLKFIAMKNDWFFYQLRNRNREDPADSHVEEMESQSKSKSMAGHSDEMKEEVKMEEEERYTYENGIQRIENNTTDKDAHGSNLNLELDHLSEESYDDDNDDDNLSYSDDYLELIIK